MGDSNVEAIMLFLSRMDVKLDEIREKQEEMSGKVLVLEDKVGTLRSDLDGLNGKVASQAGRVTDLELTRARQAGFIAALSAIIATAVTFLKDHLGNLF